MTIVNVQVQFFQAHRQQVHDVTNVKVENPVVLVLHSEDCLDVVLQLDMSRLGFWQGLGLPFALVNIVIGRLLRIRVLFAHLEHLLGGLLVSNSPLVSIFILGNRARDPHQVIVLEVCVGKLLGRFSNLGLGRLLLFALLGGCHLLQDGTLDFIQADVLFDGELLDDGLQDVLLFIVAIVTVHASPSPLLLLERLLDVVDFVEAVKLVDDLAQDWLAVSDEQVEELFIFFNIVSLLFANNHRVLLALLLLTILIFDFLLRVSSGFPEWVFILIRRTFI